MNVASIQTKLDSSRFVRNTALCIIACAVILAYASSWNDVIIIDEDPHIGAGYSYIVKQDMRLNPEHPPLAKDLVGLALIPLNLANGAFLHESWTQAVNGQWDFGRELIFNSGNNAELITRVAKIPPLLLFACLAWMVFFWTRERYGNLPGLLSLLIIAFSPTVMAHSRFVTTDIPAALGVVTATYWFIKYLKHPSKKTFMLASVMFGIALVMKFSTILLIPFFLALVLIYNYKYIQKAIMVMLVGFTIVVWPLYAFHIWHYPIERQQNDTVFHLESFGNRTLSKPVIWASGKPIIRAPAQYALGLLMVTQRSSGGNTVYYRGEVSKAAGPGYFPFVYLIKEPLPWLILLTLAILMWFTKFKMSMSNINIKNHFDEIAMLIWLLIYWGMSMNSSLNIGVRHLLPVFPFMIILAVGQLKRLPRRAVLIVPILLTWFILENITTFPNYLSYFNQTVGGPSEGYRYVVDSNLDWGQDLKRFAQWVEKNDIKKIEFNYFGWADATYYLGEKFVWLTETKYQDLEDFRINNQSDGWLAISATYLQNNRDTHYTWIAELEPYVVIGNSIFVYRVL